MLEKELRVLEILNKISSVSQRDIASKTYISIGKVNSIIKDLEQGNYINVEKVGKKTQYKLTNEGIKALEESLKATSEKKILISQQINKKVKEAVILAAGEASGFKKPVGFLELQDTTIIQRTIDILKENGIEKIVIIVGYESHYFQLLRKYEGIHLVENKNYKWTGTMASLALAKDIIADDFILIEGDMVFEKRTIEKILSNENRDCVFITKESGSGDEVFVQLKNNFIFKLSKDKHQFNRIDGEMIGINKISIEMYHKILEEFKSNENPYLSYEYALLDVARTYNIGYEKVEDLIWTEIDTIWQYNNLINYIYPILRSKED